MTGRRHVLVTVIPASRARARPSLAPDAATTTVVSLSTSTRRRALLMGAYSRIVGAVDVAIDALIDVAQNSRNALARVNAAKEILDRAGMSPELQVRIKLETEDRSVRVAQLLDRLDEMKANMNAVPTTAVETEPVVPESGTAALLREIGHNRD